jgi:hypothetical protein
MVELYLHSTMRLHGVVIKHMDKLTFLPQQYNCIVPSCYGSSETISPELR